MIHLATNISSHHQPWKGLGNDIDRTHALLGLGHHPRGLFNVVIGSVGHAAAQ